MRKQPALKQLRRPLLLALICYFVFFSFSGDPIHHLVNLSKSSYSQIFQFPSLFRWMSSSSNLVEKSATEFEWSDWKNLTIVDDLEVQDLNPAEYPHMSKLKLSSPFKMPSELKTTPSDHKMMSAFYCKNILTAPKAIITLADHESKKNLLDPNQRCKEIKQFKVEPLDKTKAHLDFGETKSKERTLVPPVVPELKLSGVSKADILFPKLEPELFTLDASKICKEEGHASNNCQRLMNALVAAPTNPKYFYEAYIEGDSRSIGSHYDWRFFKEIIHGVEHKEILHQLARGWQEFADLAGIMYWYAHGSLLGYIWNGQALPWDSDHDIQLPIAELDRVARNFNRTMVIQSPSEGNRSFILDINPNYVLTSGGNGENKIDGRFIDVETGIYLDLTGLTQNPQNPQNFKAKDGHEYPAKDYYRLRRAQFEGYPTYIPMHLDEALGQEYRNYKVTSFQGWVYNKKLQMWHSRAPCEFPNADFDSHARPRCEKREKTGSEEDVLKYDSDDPYVLSEAKAAESVTENFNEIEKAYSDFINNKNTDMLDQLYSLIGKYLPPVYGSKVFAQWKEQQAASAAAASTSASASSSSSVKNQ